MSMLITFTGRRTLAHLTADMEPRITATRGGVMQVDGKGSLYVIRESTQPGMVLIHPTSRMDDGTYRTVKNLGWHCDGSARAIAALLVDLSGGW